MKKLIQKLFAFIGSLFNQLSPEVRKAVAIAVNAVEALKNTIDSPMVDIATLIIPGSKDDALVNKARKILVNVLQDLKIVQERYETADQVIKVAMKDLQNTSDELRPAKLHLIAVELSKRLSGVSFGDAVLLAEWYYKKYVKK